ncbi:MAG: ferric reductase-like transmembrane domain-containing protein [Geminicoccaceae bacterium]|nr:ferric reductase-like transmembrane domain-containing protein [Geminicoccaceae bacterium]
MCAIWLALNPGIFTASGLFAVRELFIQWTGVLGIAAMSVAMVLSIRPRWMEARLGGLDKMYRIHKWLGIGVLGVSVVHWLWSEAPKWAVGAGLLAPPERGPRPEITDPVRAYLASLRGTAEGLGEWAFYGSAILLVIALMAIIPYHVFRLTHRVFPVVYLVLVFHAVVLLDYDMWPTPVGLVTALLLAGGSYAAVVSLLGAIGRGRRVAGKIAALHNFSGVSSLESEIRLSAGWPGHKAGQFAFVKSKRWEGAHPYTIASAWNPDDPKITFVTKELGDHTSTLAENLKPGQPVTVEGPYGCFTFDDDLPRQIWVGAGIGITPFIARLQALQKQDGDKPIDLFYSTAAADEGFIARLRELAARARVKLHVLVTERDGRLDAERICQTVPDWARAGVWFCGPAGFGHALRQAFGARGLDAERFHQELFEMR